MIFLNKKGVVAKLKILMVTEESNLWYLVNGANNYMTSQKSILRKLEEGLTQHVRFSDGSTMNIKGKEHITFTCKSGKTHF